MQVPTAGVHLNYDTSVASFSYFVYVIMVVYLYIFMKFRMYIMTLEATSSLYPSISYNL